MRTTAMIRMNDCGAPLTEADLASLERRLKAMLPVQYRQFLSEFNGGLPSPDIVDVAGAPSSPTDVQVFFGINRRVESSDLMWNKETFSDRISTSLLPVACDSCGNLFCLSLAGENMGEVFYVDLESMVPRVYSIAESFDGFLKKLRSF